MGTACVDSGRLTQEGARDLQQLGISPEFYAAYVGVGLSAFVVLVFFAVAAVIFWRRSKDQMALFASFTLLVFGGAAITDLADAHPAFGLPADLLNYTGQVSFGIFLYLFPDGRFVPRSAPADQVGGLRLLGGARGVRGGRLSLRVRTGRTAGRSESWWTRRSSTGACC
jgi:peptidoglycan/LPS O-acetylase OafA/YrhL